MDHVRVGVNEGLLVDPPDALQGADIAGILRAELSRMGRLDFPVRLLFLASFLQRPQLGFSQD